MQAQPFIIPTAGTVFAKESGEGRAMFLLGAPSHDPDDQVEVSWQRVKKGKLIVVINFLDGAPYYGTAKAKKE